MPQNYDHRRSNRPRREEDDPERRPNHRNTSSHKMRERSRSPPASPAPSPASPQAWVEDERARREAQRRAEMERLRMENEEEEKRLDQKGVGVGGSEERVSVAVKPQEEIVEVDQKELEGLDEEEQMRKLMGIEGFGSTKGKKVESNHNSLAAGAASKHKARTYRQYMNRTLQ